MIFTDRSKEVLLLRILFCVYSSRFSLLYCLLCSLQPRDHLLGKAVLCVMFPCAFVTFPYGTCADPEGDRGTGPPSLKNHKNIGFHSNTGLDSLKIAKLPSQHSMLGHHQQTSKTPFKWRFAGGPMMTRL